MESDDSLDLIDESKLKIVFTHPEQDPTVSAFYILNSTKHTLLELE